MAIIHQYACNKCFYRQGDDFNQCPRCKEFGTSWREDIYEADLIQQLSTSEVVVNMLQWIDNVEAIQPTEPNKPSYSENAPNEPPENEGE